MADYPHRYEGVRWSLLYGGYDGIETFAVNELQRIVQRCQPYVVAVREALAAEPAKAEHTVLVGTLRHNPALADLFSRRGLPVPEGREAYTLAALADPGKDGVRVLAVAGADPKGVLNGVAALGSGVVGRHVTGSTIATRREAFDRLPDFVSTHRPVLDNRGIWTWGYVIYDYRRFLDNMARLRMNMLVIWNDCAPLNLSAIVAYAHARGIRIVCGYHWGWGLANLNLDDPAARQSVKRHVLDTYEREYATAGLDGIYFQTQTEHADTELRGRSTAALACEWVNDIGRALLDRHPDLYIQFGLHATSITKHYPDLRPLDERIAIVWEDAGVVPYCTICREGGEHPFDYVPELEFPLASHMAKHGLGDFPATLDYSKRLAALRGPAEFGLCPKGFSNLSWRHEFEHHGPFVMGERSDAFVRQRYLERKGWMDAMDQRWMLCYPQAAQFYREVRAEAKGAMTAVALVEDALFEAAIHPCVALYAETVWDPHRDDERLLEAAMSPYYRSDLDKG